MYLFVLLFIEYISSVQENKYVDYDVRTITAADYSVEFPITKGQYEYWKDHFKQQDNPMSEMAQFKIFIQETLEERLNQMDHQGFDDEDDKYYKIG